MKNKFLFGILVVAAALSSSAAYASIIDLSVLPIGYFSTPLTVGDYKFTPLTDGTPAPAQIVKVNGVFGVNGTNSNYGDNLKLTRTDGKEFTLISVDIGRVASYYANGAEVNTATGYVNLNNVAGPTLKTITFDSSFANVKFVQLNSQNGPYFSNINVESAVPEPTTYATLLAGLGLMGFMVRRRRTS